jgi:hypothetical protein
MSEHEDPDLPPLPHEIRFEIQAFRAVKPKKALEQRISKALDASKEALGSSAEGEGEERGSNRSSFPLSFPLPRAFALGAAALVLAIAGGIGLQRYASRGADRQATTLAVKLSDDGDEHTWVDLPIETHRHPEGEAAVYADTPASVTLHLPHASIEASRMTSCSTRRCVHHWKAAPAGASRAPSPRVGIKAPGRYEVTVKHTSPDLHYEESFVIHATKE